MNSENVVKHLRALWRTDRIIAEIRMRHMLVGLGLRAFAALIAAFGLLMLELSAYFTGMVHHPLNSALPLVLVPLITIIIKSLKKSRAAAPAAKAATEPN